ncbi:DUF2512 family protein [Paenibacillus chondroitinus]|uniref:DUF2512 family protein n=1 Tax=Paenibacillus chondroitinus TaxID=59842 RepID=A0ABU6DKH7_9BACL|nr:MULTISPECIES: DUF2512 family protein [Paenibacillus]MCY9657510.1 YndM family protein [Paenibacillus anseongense]MEB4797840.1 DUF2512 family protein [Paenibacillus chondroitinus]
MLRMLGKMFLKLLLNGVFIIPLLMYLTQATFLEAFFATYAFSLMSYVAIDQLFLRVTNNGVATLADVGLAFIFFWLVERYFFDWSINFMNVAIVALVFGIIEFFMHSYFQKDRGRLDRHSFSDN